MSLDQITMVRCPAAHAQDPRPCEGRPDAVRIVDQTGTGVAACVLHGAVLLASLQRARVYSLYGPARSALEVFARARTLPPFDFLTDPGGQRPHQLHKLADSSARWGSGR